MAGFIYILTNASKTVLYTGVTNDLQRRIEEHRASRGRAFSSRYRVAKLVYFEQYDRIEAAIAREKQIKSWSRKRKVHLIATFNKPWKDLYEEYGGPACRIVWNREPMDRG